MKAAKPRTLSAVSSSSRAALAAFLGLGSLGCPTPPAVCETPARAESATSEDRRLLGAASPYPADGMLASRTAELEGSQAARRAAAWEIVARVFAPIPLAQPTSVDGASVPRFRTWYDRGDLARVFQRAYEGLGPTGRRARMHLSAASLDEAFAWGPTAILDVPGWTEDRFTMYALGIADEAEVAGVAGLVRIGMSPDNARHVAESYPEILRCLAEGSPPGFVDGPAEGMQRLVREPVSLASCETRTLGPYFVATGARIEARFERATGALGRLRLLRGETPALADEVCLGPSDLPCEAEGPGAFYVELESTGEGLTGMLDVTHAAPDVAIAGCLNGVFPLASATVAAEWRRAEFDGLPTYDTSAAALAAHLAGDASWGDGETIAMPGPDEIYTMRVPAGSTFVLAGLHVRTRELDNWVNITLWWSPTPDRDFGADRPASVEALGAPWNNYAMCVSIDDVESDPDPAGGATDPTLAAALTAVHEGVGGPTWCSNPYIDGAPGLVRSNCVGCHQHAFTGVRPGETVMDETRYPSHGRLLVRNNMPGDQFWGLDGGDDLAAMIQETVDYWDTTDPP